MLRLRHVSYYWPVMVWFAVFLLLVILWLNH